MMGVKLKPTGYIATCQCGKVIGALDALRTMPDQARCVLLRWLEDGCSVTAMHGSEWTAAVAVCQCHSGRQGSPE